MEPERPWLNETYYRIVLFVNYIDQITTDIGYCRVQANEHAITHIGFYDNKTLSSANTITQMALEQLKDYFCGNLRQFDFALNAKGTEFQQQVWNVLKGIKYGETASYLDIANALGKPKACRAVGAANGKNPIAVVVPCHRIIGSSGKLTGYAGGLERKQFLLELEGAF